MVTATVPAGSHAASSKSDLSPGRQRLVELMQDVNFGRIHGLRIVAREPVLEPSPHVVREVKFGGENGPRPEAAITDFTLKSQVVELFRHFDTLIDGSIEVLEIKHGLPFRMTVVAAA